MWLAWGRWVHINLIIAAPIHFAGPCLPPGQEEGEVSPQFLMVMRRQEKKTELGEGERIREGEGVVEGEGEEEKEKHDEDLFVLGEQSHL